MNFYKTKIVVLLLMFNLGVVYAQDAVVAAGGSVSGTTGTVSHSVGQVVYTAVSNTNGSINQGVQQPYDISTISTGSELENGITLSVFPNPTKDVLTLKIEDADVAGYSYELYNNLGQLIRQEGIDQNQVEISTQDLSAATYILKVKSTNDVLRVFSVIKH